MIKLFHPLNIRGSAERHCEAAVSSDGESYDTSEVVKSGISGMKTLSFNIEMAVTVLEECLEVEILDGDSDKNIKLTFQIEHLRLQSTACP